MSVVVFLAPVGCVHPSLPFQENAFCLSSLSFALNVHLYLKSESSQTSSAHEHIYSYDDCSLEPTSPCLYFAKALPPGRSIRGSLFLGVSKGCLHSSTKQSTLLGVTLNSGHFSIPKGIPSRHPYGTSIYCALHRYHCTLTGCTYETRDLFSVIIYRLVLKKYKALFLVLYCIK